MTKPGWVTGLLGWTKGLLVERFFYQQAHGALSSKEGGAAKIFPNFLFSFFNLNFSDFFSIILSLIRLMLYLSVFTRIGYILAPFYMFLFLLTSGAITSFVPLIFFMLNFLI